MGNEGYVQENEGNKDLTSTFSVNGKTTVRVYVNLKTQTVTDKELLTDGGTGDRTIMKKPYLDRGAHATSNYLCLTSTAILDLVFANLFAYQTEMVAYYTNAV